MGAAGLAPAALEGWLEERATITRVRRPKQSWVGESGRAGGHVTTRRFWVSNTLVAHQQTAVPTVEVRRRTCVLYDRAISATG